MADRHNLCQNPACSVSIAGWGGDGAAPTRNTGLVGFPRATGASYATSGTFARTQIGNVTGGVQYTISAYVRPNSLAANGHIYAEWTGSGTSYTSSPYSAPFGSVTRISHTGTAPGGATAVAVIIDGVGNFGVNPMDITAVLIEPVGAVDTYFDGSSPNASWDGVAGLSASTLHDAAPIDASLAGAIPMQAAALTGEALAEALLAGAIPMQQVALVGGAVFAVPPSDWLIEQAAPYWRISQD